MLIFNKIKERSYHRSRHKTIELPVLRIGRPNGIGNIYTEDSVKDMLDIFYEEKSSKIYGDLVGWSYVYQRSNPTHWVERIFIEDGFLIAVTNFKDTKGGMFARQKIEDGQGMLRPTIRGYVHQETKEITVTDIISFDILAFSDIEPESIEWINVMR